MTIIHRGGVLLNSIRDGVVEVMLYGACRTCSRSGITMKEGIEARLRQKIANITAVVEKTKGDILK